MEERQKYKFDMGNGKEIVLELGKGVFTPTGTTKILFNSVKDYIKVPGKILDLGCGCGVMGIALQQSGVVKGDLHASDLSKGAVDVIKMNAGKYNCPLNAKWGSLFEPWHGEKFDYIVDDVSGVSKEVAKVSPWFDNVPCDSGDDGAFLLSQVIKEAAEYMNAGGRLFFPVVSFSDVNKIIETAKQYFSHVELLACEEWPLPKEMNQHLEKLKELQQKGYVHFTEKFGMVLWFTQVYVAYND